MGSAGEDVADADTDAEPRVGIAPSSRGVPVHATITRSTAAVARDEVRPRKILKGFAIIATTLTGRWAVRPLEPDIGRKCDKTTPFGLTAHTPLSYVGCALIGVNRGRGAGKGR